MNYKRKRILVIGSGGREHCLVWKIKQSSNTAKVFCAPGNAGTAKISENVNILACDIEKLADFAKKENIDLTVVGPEAALAKGITDKFISEGLKIFGPDKKSAMLESSKVFSKRFMKKYHIPTAEFEIFDSKQKADSFLKKNPGEWVIKADGLAAGKGVFVCSNTFKALNAVKEIMEDRKFQDSGNRIVIEKKLSGEEVSLIALCDGKNIIPLASSQDHKAVGDGDKGPNTGGMGAYSPAPVLEGRVFEETFKIVMEPLLDAIKKEMQNYKGVLYAGLMMTENGPYVLEFNVRFGDPEIQAILPRLKTDFVDVLNSVEEGNLDKINLQWDKRACVCVVMSSGGYPGNYETGKEITGLPAVRKSDDSVVVFHAGTKFKDGKFLTDAGRVLGVSALGEDIEDAISRSYNAVEKINFKAAYYRKDIGQKAVKRLKKEGKL